MLTEPSRAWNDYVHSECEALISQLDLDGETMQAALFRRKLTHATGGL